jgi:exopolyphosphatase / guanosine-5'-triphosphate,3'-diphosphate pyrophosphatase
MRVAAVDLGSNSFHLVIADVHPDGSFTPVSGEKEMLRLGDVVSREGMITPEAADAAVATMRRFRLMAEAAGATEFLACATSALRTASNGDEVLDRIASEAGVEADVIDGLEEARLIFTAIRAGVTIDPAPAVCFDLGGGSLEIMVGDVSGLAWAASERLGVARLSAEFVRSDPIDKGDRRRLRKHILDVLAPRAVEAAIFEPKMAIGSSGTIEDLGHIIAARRDESVPRTFHHLTFSRSELDALQADLITSTNAQRRKIAGLDAKRVDLIVAGVEIMSIAMELFEVDQLTVSEWALREGMVLDAIGRHDPAEWSDDPFAIRRASVTSLARRCSWPEEHSRHVAMLALELFDQLRELHGLADEDRELLEYAALLHDIGEHVAHEGHDRHAAYLVNHGRLRGLTPAAITELSGLVRWHRRGDPKGNDDLVGQLDGEQRDRVRRICALLRIADGLDRGRKQVVTGVNVRVGPELVLLHVRAQGDPELELWGARRKRDLFEKVFDRELELTAHPAGG